MSNEMSKIEWGSNLALIPARGGSKGVPHKNIRLLKGFPLLAYSIIAAKLSRNIQRIVVSTDSEEIAEVAQKFGAEVPFMRPAIYANDKSKDFEFVNHALHWFSDNEERIPEYIIHLRPTTPVRNPEIIDQAIELIKESKSATSLRSAHKASESPFKWFIKKENGYFASILEGLSNEEANAGRQSFSTVYIPDGYVDVIKTEFVLKEGILHGENLLGFESPKCYEIDEEKDFFLLEYQIEKYGSILLEYLVKNFSELRGK